MRAGRFAALLLAAASAARAAGGGLVLIDDLGLRVKAADAATVKAAGLKKGAKALVVVEAMMSSPASEAGLVPGDVVVKIDGKPVHSPTDLDKKVHGLKVGRTLALDVLRGGQPVKATFAVRIANTTTPQAAPPSAVSPAETPSATVPATR